IYKVFFMDKSAAFTTPGHEEIELALVKLYRLTNNKKYLDLAEFFIDSRGQKNEREYNGVDHKYSQSHLPVRKQKTAEGHCVRAGYLYSAMADIAKIENDEELFDACRSIFDDIISKKMYITGGTGSAARGEAFTIPYDLPNLTAYSESCSALALAWFAARMSIIEPDSKYADTVERVIYNNGLSGISLDGNSFFYVNPLEIRTELLNRNTSQSNTSENLPITGRLEVFDCSCCPPNITRFISSIADFMYTYQEDEVFVHQYIMSKTQTEHFIISQETDYPNSGRIKITAENIGKIALRIPFWCREYEIFLNGTRAEYILDKGYAYINLNGAHSEIGLNLKITTTLVYPSPKIHDCKGTVAVMRGPVVYCAEGIDNEFSVSEFVISSTPEFSEEYSDYFGTYVLYADGKAPRDEEHLYSFDPPEYEQAKIKLIPYFGFANRGQSDMEVYLLK
ncbi:MAG: glycoside hydrolase family 127 protein, partial [Clostridiales bacterium]|nr:glycoside hydrolase family 127 protein [Clostridiales bacterium]